MVYILFYTHQGWHIRAVNPCYLKLLCDYFEADWIHRRYNALWNYLYVHSEEEKKMYNGLSFLIQCKIKKLCLIWIVNYLRNSHNSDDRASWEGAEKKSLIFWIASEREPKTDWVFTTPTVSVAARSVFSTNTKDIYLLRFVESDIFFVFHFCFHFLWKPGVRWRSVNSTPVWPLNVNQNKIHLNKVEW